MPWKKNYPFVRHQSGKVVRFEPSFQRYMWANVCRQCERGIVDDQHSTQRTKFNKLNNKLIINRWCNSLAHAFLSHSGLSNKPHTLIVSRKPEVTMPKSNGRSLHIRTCLFYKWQDLKWTKLRRFFQTFSFHVDLHDKYACYGYFRPTKTG